jgi:lambda family phage tail tape measure protein
LDTTATQGVNSLTTAIVDFEMGNKSAAQSARDLETAVLTSIDQMIVKMMIAAPIAQSLQQIIGGFLPGGGPTETSLPSLGAANAAFSANGNIFGSASIAAFANGGAFTNGIFSRPTLFRFANGGAMGLGVMGEAGDEAVMPLRRGAGGKLGVAATVPSVAINLAPQVNISVDNRNGSKVSTGPATPNKGGGFDMSIIVADFDAALADRISTGRSPTGKVMAQQFGLQRQFG